MTPGRATVQDRLKAAFAAAGVRGVLHAVDLDSGREVELGADEPSVLASVFKLPVLVAAVRAADDDRIDLSSQVMVPREGRAPGSTGLSVMSDPVTLSLRDLLRWMIVVSDNAATDVVVAQLGWSEVHRTLHELGCHDTVVAVDCAGLFASMAEDAGVASPADLPTELSAGAATTWRVLQPQLTNRGTPRDLTRLLASVWLDEAASPQGCAFIREVLLQQVWPHRLASGFPESGVCTGGKTGTLPGRRNESGVVLYPDGGRYAVSVFTTAKSLAARHPAADAVIGRAARIAVDALRRERLARRV